LHRRLARLLWRIAGRIAGWAEKHEALAFGVTKESTQNLPYDFHENSFWRSLNQDDAFNAAMQAICAAEIHKLRLDMQAYVNKQDLFRAGGAGAAIEVFMNLVAMFKTYAREYDRPRVAVREKVT